MLWPEQGRCQWYERKSGPHSRKYVQLSMTGQCEWNGIINIGYMCGSRRFDLAGRQANPF